MKNDLLKMIEQFKSIAKVVSQDLDKTLKSKDINPEDAESLKKEKKKLEKQLKDLKNISFD